MRIGYLYMLLIMRIVEALAKFEQREMILERTNYGLEKHRRAMSMTARSPSSNLRERPRSTA
ncbi:hypothetical protein [Agrobacterium tumefaciens]|uniref:hypothetical protein n=1 Tax=Agrobacterium tumefaciens TaxID=358 RepID=UPI000DD075BF